MAETDVPAPPFLYLARDKLLTSDQVVPSYCSVFASALPGGAGAPPHIRPAVFTSAAAPINRLALLISAPSVHELPS